MYRLSRFVTIISVSLCLALLFGISVSAQVTDFTPVVINEKEQEGEISDGVWYGPIDLSGMTYDEARKSIALYVLSLQEQ